MYLYNIVIIHINKQKFKWKLTFKMEFTYTSSFMFALQ